ncbi:signal peptidase I [Intestinibaculum porci]|uniref:signal peptidase I n=1 Tax=Intestinibaculum porci TaxID=2487118 RepID=UPI0024097E4E|nr:signal peptidase I [Intestinibaculum porci]MDD6350149.1 signal peptidase I [Intestinibaculum porci]
MDTEKALKAAKRKKRILILAPLLLFGFSLYVLILPVVVSGESMMNTLHDGDFAFVSKTGLRHVHRFDIVVINSKKLNEKIVKRVIGLPGETIEYKDDKLYVNGTYTKEDFLDPSWMTYQKTRLKDKRYTHNFKVTLGENQYFCMGDNRLNSVDSRELGPFERKDIIGRGGFILFPITHIKSMNQ